MMHMISCSSGAQREETERESRREETECGVRSERGKGREETYGTRREETYGTRREETGRRERGTRREELDVDLGVSRMKHGQRTTLGSRHRCATHTVAVMAMLMGGVSSQQQAGGNALLEAQTPIEKLKTMNSDVVNVAPEYKPDEIHRRLDKKVRRAVDRRTTEVLPVVDKKQINPNFDIGEYRRRTMKCPEPIDCRTAAMTAKQCSGQECSICLEPLSDDEQSRFKTSCDHLFHETCFLEWVFGRPGKGATCPLCRHNEDAEVIKLAYWETLRVTKKTIDTVRSNGLDYPQGLETAAIEVLTILKNYAKQMAIGLRVSHALKGVVIGDSLDSLKHVISPDFYDELRAFQKDIVKPGISDIDPTIQAILRKAARTLKYNPQKQKKFQQLSKEISFMAPEVRDGVQYYCSQVTKTNEMIDMLKAAEMER